MDEPREPNEPETESAPPPVAEPVSSSDFLDDDAPEAGPPELPEFVQVAKRQWTRALKFNLQDIEVTPDEEAGLRAVGIENPNVQRYAVWRRSLLWIGSCLLFLSFLFGIGDLTNMGDLSGGGKFFTVINWLSMLVLPIFGTLAALSWKRLRLTARMLWLAGAISFAIPFAIALTPVSWWISLPRDRAQLTVARMFMGFGVFLAMAPVALSLIPGACRASLRIKTLFPASLAPGWGLVAGAPLHLLLAAVAFLLLYHLVGNLLLMIGVLFFVGAPLLYLFRRSLLTRPVTQKSQLRELAKLQQIVLASCGFGALLVVIFLFATEFPLTGRALMGFDSSTSVMQPWSAGIHAFWTSYLGRSLMMSVIFGDLLARVCLSMWREEIDFAKTEYAERYGTMMRDLNDAIGSKDLPPAEPVAELVDAEESPDES